MGDEFTIDELARRSGQTTRNIRAHQERGLLPPPTVRGRVGFYGEAHLARLRHVAQLQERGFSLQGIRELFDAWERGHGLAQVLGFEEALAAPWDDEPAGELMLGELQAFFGVDDDALERSVRLGLLEQLDDGRYRVPSPRLLRAGAALVTAGVPLGAVLDEASALWTDLDAVACRFVQLFLDHVWRPYVDRGAPSEDLPAITESLVQLRSIAVRVVEPMLAAAMGRHVDAVSAETLAGVRQAGLHDG